jgi:hypothetical protein
MKTVVISTNANPDYCFWLPICEAFWNRAGFEVFAFTNGESKQLDFAVQNFKGKTYQIGNIEGVRHETVSQVSRLFGHLFVNGYIMTADVDMLTLDKDYFKPNEKAITVYGHDLTGYSQYPICYIGMPKDKWQEVMPAVSLEQGIYDLCVNRYASKNNSTDFFQWWDIDQQAITDSLHGVHIDSILRGADTATGFAKGRYDRAKWVEPSCRIDAHMPRNNWQLSKGLVNQYFDFNEYAEKFYSL